jgi:hypothetical protein
MNLRDGGIVDKALKDRASHQPGGACDDRDAVGHS